MATRLGCRESLFTINISLIYSPCDCEWLHCIPEDEKYLRTKTLFYDACDIVESSGIILKSASDNTCLGSRRCVNGQSSTDGLPYVGYDPFGTCTCSAKQNTVSSTYTTENRYKRQVDERFATVARDCRVQRTAKGRKRKVCDTTRQTGRYDMIDQDEQQRTQ